LLDESIEEVVQPQILNDFDTERNNRHPTKELKATNSKLKNSTRAKPKSSSPEISAKKTIEMQPKVLEENSPVLKSFLPKTNTGHTTLTKAIDESETQKCTSRILECNVENNSKFARKRTAK